MRLTNLNEEKTISIINLMSGTKLISTNSVDKFCSYDAEDKNYIVEIKNRRDYYEDKMIECSKMFTNYNIAQAKGKRFLYVVTDRSGLSIFNISENISTIAMVSPDVIQCPINTDFGKEKIYINKYCYNIKGSSAVEQYPIELIERR